VRPSSLVAGWRYAHPELPIFLVAGDSLLTIPEAIAKPLGRVCVYWCGIDYLQATTAEQYTLNNSLSPAVNRLYTRMQPTMPAIPLQQ
jgi:hypothetical protein